MKCAVRADNAWLFESLPVNDTGCPGNVRGSAGFPESARTELSTTILIVDDNATLAYFSARNLQRDLPGTQVFSATSCREAWDAAELHRPAVLVADWKLADGEGLGLIREMSARFPDLQAILISGEEPDPASRRDLFGFLVKPYETTELAGLVGRALSRKAPEDASEKSVRNAVPSYDRHHMRNRLAGLLAGLRAFGADLRARANDPDAVNATVDEYLDRLCAAVQEVSSMLPKAHDE
jgi:ActR/RegA family two-component response regulator